MDIIFERYDNLFEALSSRPDILKKIELLLSKLSTDLTNKSIIIEIEQALQEFTHIPEIKIIIEDKWNKSQNAAIIGIPKMPNVLSLISNWTTSNQAKQISPEITMKDIEQEIPKYIQKGYIIISPTLFINLTSQEIMSIILHELGHLYIHDFSILKYVYKILTTIVTKSLKYSAILSFLLKSPVLFNGLGVSIFCFTRTLTFLEHRSEYNADRFPIKYGYGDDFINVLTKFERSKILNNQNNTKIMKIISTISSIFSPSSHPSTQSRIKNILKIIRKDYSLIYKEVDDKIIAMTAEYI